MYLIASRICTTFYWRKTGHGQVNILQAKRLLKIGYYSLYIGIIIFKLDSNCIYFTQCCDNELWCKIWWKQKIIKDYTGGGKDLSASRKLLWQGADWVRSLFFKFLQGVGAGVESSLQSVVGRAVLSTQNTSVRSAGWKSSFWKAIEFSYLLLKTTLGTLVFTRWKSK